MACWVSLSLSQPVKFDKLTLTLANDADAAS